MRWEDAGEVSELVIYPLKSARGIPQNDAEVTIYGLAQDHLEDRVFMVIDEHGTFISCRQVDTLASVVTKWEGRTLTLKAEGIEDVSVNIDEDLKNQPVWDIRMRELRVPGVDCGDKVGEWITKVLNNGDTKYRIVYKGDVLTNRPSRKPDFFEFKQFRKTDRVYYADNTSYMIGCQSSLDDLNSRLAEPVLMENFRPNIIIKGTKAYDEDDWIYVKIGQVVLRRLKPCERCLLIAIDPITGKRHKDLEPLTTMRKYRLLKDPPKLAKIWETKPIFGLTLSPDSTGHIAVGDKVSIARASVHPHLRGF